MSGLLVHLLGMCIGIAQHIACKLDRHHLETKAETEGGYVMFATILGSDELSFDTTVAESRTDDYAIHIFEQLLYVVLVDVF